MQDPLPTEPHAHVSTGPTGAPPPDDRLKRVMGWAVVVVLVLFGTATLVGLFFVGRTEGTFWQDLIAGNFPVVIGLPMAGLGALFVSLVLQISSGPIEFEVAGVRFKGGSAPIVFWLLCFLVISGAIKVLWRWPPA